MTKMFPDFLRSFHRRPSKRQAADKTEVLKAHNLKMMSVLREDARYRHDYRHQLCALYALLSEGETQKALDYLETLIPAVKWQNPLLFCENPILNAYLNYYGSRFSEKNIRFTANVKAPAALPLPDVDLSCLLGNLLENALEACERQAAASPYVLLRIKYRNGELFIHLENSLGAPAVIQNGRLLSAKTGRGGIGTRSIRSIAARFNGSASFEQDGKSFFSTVILPLGPV